MLTARIEERRGQLVGALIVRDADEIFAITSAGVVIRMSVQPLRYLSRATSGVKLVALDRGSSVVAVALNGEAAADQVTAAAAGESAGQDDTAQTGVQDGPILPPSGQDGAMAVEGSGDGQGEGVPGFAAPVSEQGDDQEDPA